MRTLKKGGMYFKRMSFIIGSLVLLVILFCCSAFFSASETSLFSLSPLKVRHLEKHGGATGRIIARLLAHPSRLLVTILMGNEVVNILASSTAAALWIRLLGDDLGSVTATVSMVFLLLIFGEVTPKTYAVRFPEWFASFACRPLLLLSYVNFPVRVILTGIADGILRLLGGTRTGHERIWTGQEFRTMLDVSEREGVVEAAERKIIANLIDFNEVSVKEIMIPRTDMLCFSVEDSFETLIEKCRAELYARVPVYHGSIDNIIGVVYAKDLLPFIYKPRHEFDLRRILREAYFVPETKKVQELLKDFQDRKKHIAIVVDEYGGISGLVSLEDILEEIVGEIKDEFDTDDIPRCFPLREGRLYRVNALMHIHEFNQEFGTDFSPEYYGTVAGFMLEHLGQIPKKGDVVKTDGLTFTVSKLRNMRILEVVVEKETSPDSDA